MSEPTPLPLLPQAELERCDVLRAGVVNLRRDVYQFVKFVAANGLTRTVRENGIPRTVARKLALLLSYAGETAAIEEEGRGFWSDSVSLLARQLGLVKFDVEGVYRGHSSTEPSFPDNDVLVDDPAWQAWLCAPAVKIERALLDALIESRPNEFFHAATLVAGEPFDPFGCATGAAGRMDLGRIRGGLCELLAGLEPDVWYETRGFVERLRSASPGLILDPATREPDRHSHDLLRKWEWACQGVRKGPKPPRPDLTYDDIYANFRERDPKGGWGARPRQLTAQLPDAFHRVEGRYVEFFLREIPYLMGFVDLAWRRARDRHGLDAVPPCERLRAFRLTRRLAAVWRADPELDRVTTRVLPNLEIVVDAASYPERVLEAIAPYAERVREDGPVHQFRLERRKVVAAVAANPAHREVAEVLAGLSGAALPENVATELAAWCGHAEKVTLYEGLGLVEVADPAARPAVCAALGDLVADDRPAGFLLVCHGAKPAGTVRRRFQRPADRARGGEKRPVGMRGRVWPGRREARTGAIRLSVRGAGGEVAGRRCRGQSA